MNILKKIWCFIFNCAAEKEYNKPTEIEISGLEKEFIDVINNYRQTKVKAEKTLKSLAFQHSLDMSATKVVSHYDFYNRVEKVNNIFGTQEVDEIIAYNYSTPKATLNAWLNSPGHKRVLDNNRYNYAGVGLVKDVENKIYITILFAKL